jgi:hypothetical protein
VTIQTLRGKRSRGAKSKGPEPIAIGERDSNIFNCPTCARPLGVGAPRCPGCGTRLLIGVQAKRAMIFIAVGLVAGLLIGGSSMAAVAAVTRTLEPPAASAAPIAVASAAPVAAPVVTPPPAQVDPAVPALALSALRQATQLNQRIATDAGKLAGVLAAGDASSADIAKSLRALSTDASIGAGLATDVAAWADGSDVSIALSDLYRSMASAAASGLDASFANRAAYLSAGRRMLTAIDGLADLDGSVVALAATAGLDLQPIVLPDELD